jgi:acyl-coenzyme A thioesterase PaaI-like protein
MTQTYPPERHLLRDLDITTEQVTARRSVSLAPVDDAVRNHAGSAGIGFVAAVVDVNCATVALVAGQPDWTATADLALYGLRGLTDGPAIVDSRLVRAGTGIVVVGVDVYDGHGIGSLDDLLAGGLGDGDQLTDRRPLELATAGLVTFSRIPASASRSSSTFTPGSLIGQRRRMEPAAPRPEGTLLERVGLRVLHGDGGVVELDNHDYVQNSFGAINGGALGVLFQGAAEAALPGYSAADLQIHYLAQIKEGGTRTTVRVLRRGDEHAVCSVSAVEIGRPDRVIALATVTLLSYPSPRR